MTNQQRWRYGDWMLKAKAEAKQKQRRRPVKPQPGDIFKYEITKDKNEGDVQVYSRKDGKVLFEAESYDEARRVLEEQYGMGA